MTSFGESLESALASLILEIRTSKKLTMEGLADLAEVHRTSIGLIERGGRGMTVGMAAQITHALRVRLSDLIGVAEDRLDEGLGRTPLKDHFLNSRALEECTGLTTEMLASGVISAYRTLDIIDRQLVAKGTQPIAKLVELANLSSMIGNLLGSGIAEASRGLYRRNKPHAYPDLVPLGPPAVDLEIKTALETNRPKGHLAKAGCYLTFRYVLADASGRYLRGRSSRGDMAWIWEIRVGNLTVNDFDLSNTEGDSGKTAVIKTKALAAMPVVYFVPEYLPYAKADRYHAANGAMVIQPGTKTPEGQEPRE